MNIYYDNNKGMSIAGNFWLVHPKTGEQWNKESVAQFIAEAQLETEENSEVEYLKQQVITRIKQLAYSKLQSEQWRVERAKERELSERLNGNEEGAATERANLLDILQQREVVREKSGELEAAVLSLTTQAELLQFVIAF
ncbi:hypothetical protein [Pseudoalteromonas sp. DY56-GL79]|uniref:hypothetical protein n=1 Tax=Pseudoalteromonas sp. DY56-GL79 TaxID=2967131 RepID=UPI00352B8C0A